VGVCVFTQKSNNAADLHKHADTAMYEAKVAGKNQIHDSESPSPHPKVDVNR
jgi:GGDEF domain-containing protein